MKTPISLLRRVAARRPVIAIGLVFVLVVLVVLAVPGRVAADVYSNIAPASQLPAGSLVERYPLSHLQIDEYFPAISVSLISGIDVSGIGPMIAYFIAQVVWDATALLAHAVITVFAFAFSLNLIGNGTPGSGGALAPIAQAIHNLYTHTFGTPWLVTAVVAAGLWAMWKALVQRRYTETAGGLAVSVIYCVLAIGIVTQPQRTIAPASALSNEISTSLLSLTSNGAIESEAQAKTTASNQMFSMLVLDPWTVLEFGGLEHCAVTREGGEPHSVAVRPLSSNPAQDTRLAEALENHAEIQAQRKTCINNREKYAAHFLAYEFESKGRNSEHSALEHGENEDLPLSDPGRTNGTYHLGPADEPAAEAMGKSGQYQRLLLSLVILVGDIGGFLLIGALAFGVILAQILLLLFLAFSPVALLVGIFPGRGHAFFKAWFTKLAGYLARKVIYSLILAVLLTVCQALTEATSNLGWLMSFALQAALLWAVFLQRHRLTADLLGATSGGEHERTGTGAQAAYYATRLAGLAFTPRPKNPPPDPPAETPVSDKPSPPSHPPSSPSRRGLPPRRPSHYPTPENQSRARPPHLQPRRPTRQVGTNPHRHNTLPPTRKPVALLPPGPPPTEETK